MTTKCYIGKLCERNGEYEYSHFLRFKLDPQTIDPAQFLETVASNWYGGPADEEDDGYYFNGGEVHVSAARATEISQDVFDALESVLPEMHPEVQP